MCKKAILLDAISTFLVFKEHRVILIKSWGAKFHIRWKKECHAPVLDSFFNFMNSFLPTFSTHENYKMTDVKFRLNILKETST